MVKFDESLSVIQEIELGNSQNIRLFIKRDDLIHPEISGNKYRKLKYNLIEARKLNHQKLLTFGGAFSNHISAVAAAGQLFGFKTIGMIRGEELQDKIDLNPTLKFSRTQGMTLKFLSREEYRLKDSEDFKAKLKEKYGEFYLIPEGGTNDLAVKGTAEILTSTTEDFDYICSSVGTGGTLAGLINCSKPRQQVLGFSALKGDFLKDDIAKFANKWNWKLISNYHFGGYGKINSELIDFINDFKIHTNVPLDPIYTGKMLFGVVDLIKKGYFKENSQVLAIHTGGLQGIRGMNLKLKQKNLPIIL